MAAGWDSPCAGDAVGSAGILCWQRWAARPTHSLVLSITRVLAAFGDFRTSCSCWYPWRRSPKPLPSPRCPLFVSFKQNQSETRVFSEGRWTHSQTCCRASDAASMDKREKGVFHMLGPSANVCAAGCKYCPLLPFGAGVERFGGAQGFELLCRGWNDTEKVLG